MQTTQQLPAKVPAPVPEKAVNEFVPSILNTPVVAGLIAHNNFIADSAVSVAKKAVCLAGTSPDADSINNAISALTNDELVQKDTFLQEVQGRLSGAKTKQENYRKPLTTAFADKVVGAFTAAEKRVDASISAIVGLRKLLALEIKRRNEKSEEDKQRDVNRANERAQYMSEARAHINKRAVELAKLRNEGLIRRFYAITAEDFETYSANLASWKPSTTQEEFMKLCEGFNFTWRYHDPTKERLPVADSAELEGMKKEADTIFFQLVNTEREMLMSKVPQRKLELASGVGVNVADVKSMIEESAKTADEVGQSAQDSIKMDAAVQKVDNEFNASVATPALQQTSGTSQRKVLKPSTHTHWAAIIALYIDQEFPHLSMEEIEKKFSFMRTKINNNGNALQTWPVGVPLEDDVSVRGRKPNR